LKSDSRPDDRLIEIPPTTSEGAVTIIRNDQVHIWTRPRLQGVFETTPIGTDAAIYPASR
jgi:hypothetical protein